ncbi:sigma-E factor regulatory protein RseB domain-containing protein [Pseudokineococcus basanitobsidens]|uniref:Sigma-E factor regulatory protein RseB domain-containing protein n=1 Tax=Pseudokineococcus basanitobsidens TaxID=1926649 RepID=A0ABU8RG59_9ACTN
MNPRTRWTLAAATTGAVVGGAVLVPMAASADPDLPPTTADELLTEVASAQQVPFSGTVVHTTDLGLPELPQTAGGSGSDLSNLLAGSTTLRLWSDGPERGRVAVLGSFAETDLVRDGQDAWVWRSDERTAVHVTLPDAEELAAARDRGPTRDGRTGDGTTGDGSRGVQGDAPEGMADATPADLARQALDAVEPSTEVTLDGTTEVAGRDAYELVLAPRDADSLVGEVRLAVDAETSYPLRVQVLPRGADAPALETAFTSISYDTPGDDVFAFTPPAGTEVTEAPSLAGALRGRDGGHGWGPGHDGAGRDGTDRDGAADRRPLVVGDGWDAVAVLPDAAGALEAGGERGGSSDGVGQALLQGFQPVSGDFGTGRVLTTSLVSVLALDDGRVLVGAVPASVLEQAALDPAAAS